MDIEDESCVVEICSYGNNSASLESLVINNVIVIKSICDIQTNREKKKISRHCGGRVVMTRKGNDDFEKAL